MQTRACPSRTAGTTRACAHFMPRLRGRPAMLDRRQCHLTRTTLRQTGRLPQGNESGCQSVEHVPRPLVRRGRAGRPTAATLRHKQASERAKKVRARQQRCATLGMRAQLGAAQKPPTAQAHVTYPYTHARGAGKHTYWSTRNSPLVGCPPVPCPTLHLPPPPTPQKQCDIMRGSHLLAAGIATAPFFKHTGD